MFRTVSPLSLMGFVLLAAIAGPAIAESEGQADLDKATQLRVTAETLDDLNEVVDHADSALEKGLDPENKKFADQLLVSSLLQRGQLFAAALFNVPSQDPQRGIRVMQYRQFALSDLQRAVGLDDKQVEAHLLIAKLQALPLGDQSAARRSLNKIVKSEDATPDQKAEAYVLRSEIQKDKKDKLEDLNQAVALQADKPDYFRRRAEYLYQEDKFDDALADVDKALKLEPDHAATNELRGMILLGLNKYDDALKSFDRSSELMPEASLPYLHKGELYRQKGDLQKALELITKSLELSPDNVDSLVMRARLYFELKEPEKSLEDIDKAIKAQPTLAVPHFMKVEILAATNHVDQAIAHLEKLLKEAPDNEQVLERLGALYLMAEKPRQAIETATKVLDKDPENFAALRLRADANLNVGNHEAAIADFDKALAKKDDDEGVLNNLAWVLATSPDDKLRDGAKSLKLATKAAEAGNYETPHVLSTLAAAYAETGDFENAAKWSEKSIELSQKELDEAKAGDDKDKMLVIHEQLKKELENYHDHKPVRERQTAEEGAASPSANNHASAPAATSKK